MTRKMLMAAWPRHVDFCNGSLFEFCGVVVV
jgi:hypothetical protein